MRIGDFWERITIKPLYKIATSTGGYTGSYDGSNLQRWAKVEYLSQSRVTEEGTLNMSNKVRFTFRGGSEIDAIMDKTTLIEWESLNYTINDFMVDFNNFYTVVATNNA